LIEINNIRNIYDVKKINNNILGIKDKKMILSKIDKKIIYNMI